MLQIEKRAVVLGGILLDAGGQQGVVVEDFEFIQSSNLNVKAAYLMPMGTSKQLMGFVDENSDVERVLSNAIQVEPGAKPLDPDEDYNLVVTAYRGDEGEGSAKGFRLSYTSGGQAFTDEAGEDEVVVPAEGEACY